MEKIVEAPQGVELKLEGRKVIVTGPKGRLERDFSSPLFDRKIELKVEDSKLVISTKIERRKVIAFANTIAAHVRNMLLGVTKGFRYTMRIHYVHFPISIELKKEGNLTHVYIKNFQGRSKPIHVKLEDVDVEVVGEQYIVIRGIDKEKVGEAANKIEQACRVYREHDRRIFQDGIYLVRKELDEG